MTRLEILGLLSLEKRRLCGDLIQVFKILTDRENIDKHQFFTPSLCSHLRRHSFKLLKPRSSRQVCQNFFSQRVIDEWNKLPSDIVMSTSVNMFKNKLDDHWNDVSVKGYWRFIRQEIGNYYPDRPAKSPVSHGRLPHFRPVSCSPAASLKSPAFLLCRLTKF